MVKIIEIVERINKDLEVMAGKRIDDMGYLHEEAREIIDRQFRRVGSSLRYGCWDIVSHKLGYYNKPMTVHIDFKDDKRCTLERKGRLNRIWVQVDPAILELKTSDLRAFYERKQGEKKLAETRVAIEQAICRVKELKEYEVTLAAQWEVTK